MGLDAFKSDNNTSSSNSDDDESSEPEQSTPDYSLDTKIREEIEESEPHPSSKKDFHAQYDEEYYAECWECGDRKILMHWLHNLGNVWFCQNKDCRFSVQHHCEVTASSKDIAQQLDHSELHSQMEQEDFDPTEMSLDKFTGGDDDDEQPSGNKRESQMFTRDRFEEVLETTEYDWEREDYDWCGEWVYEVGSSGDEYVMRVYSSVDKRTNESRPKDGDAIRLVVLYGEDERPVLKEKRTNRIKTWPRNLKKKINNIKQRQDDIEVCDKCNSVMVIRENSNSGDKFYGCSNYPECTNTESID